MEGLDGIERMQRLMASLRKDIPSTIGTVAVLRMRDYQSQTIYDLQTKSTLPTGTQASNVLYFEMANGDNIVIRPSGTEPKIKIYYLLSAETEEAARENFEQYTKTTALWH